MVIAALLSSSCAPQDLEIPPERTRLKLCRKQSRRLLALSPLCCCPLVPSQVAQTDTRLMPVANGTQDRRPIDFGCPILFFYDVACSNVSFVLQSVEDLQNWNFDVSYQHLQNWNFDMSYQHCLINIGVGLCLLAITKYHFWYNQQFYLWLLIQPNKWSHRLFLKSDKRALGIGFTMRSFDIRNHGANIEFDTAV